RRGERAHEDDAQVQLGRSVLLELSLAFVLDGVDDSVGGNPCAKGHAPTEDVGLFSSQGAGHVAEWRELVVDGEPGASGLRTNDEKREERSLSRCDRSVQRRRETAFGKGPANGDVQGLAQRLKAAPAIAVA